jgi:hypothetical protein
VDCFVRNGSPDRALIHLKKMGGSALEDLVIYRVNEKRNVDIARGMFAKFLELNPSQPDLVMLMNRGADPLQPGPPTPGTGPPQIPGVPQLPQIPRVPRP